MKGKSVDCNVSIIGAGPYGLSAAAYLKAVNVEARIFGEPMSFWEKQMPAGMFLRSHPSASHIADPKQELTLDEYCRQNGNPVSKPVPRDSFVGYGHWYQLRAVQNLEKRFVRSIEVDPRGFKLSLMDGEEFTSRRVLVATGIGDFRARPSEFNSVPAALASHSSEHNDLSKFKGQRVVVIGAGQSALESAALLKEAGIEVEVIARQKSLRWVGLHPSCIIWAWSPRCCIRAGTLGQLESAVWWRLRTCSAFCPGAYRTGWRTVPSGQRAQVGCNHD